MPFFVCILLKRKTKKKKMWITNIFCFVESFKMIKNICVRFVTKNMLNAYELMVYTLRVDK